MQETVAVPDPVMLVGVIAPQVSPACGVSVKLTTPAKPLRAVTVIVEVAETPTLTAAGEEAAIVKSTKLKVPVAEWVSVVLVPITVSAKLPAVVELQATVAVPEPVTLVGVMAPQVRPAGGVSVKLTTPAKPFNAVIVIVEVVD